MESEIKLSNHKYICQGFELSFEGMMSIVELLLCSKGNARTWLFIDDDTIKTMPVWMKDDTWSKAFKWVKLLCSIIAVIKVYVPINAQLNWDAYGRLLQSNPIWGHFKV